MLYIGLSLFFVLGYLAIIFEKFIQVNKAASAILMAFVLWIIYFLSLPSYELGVSAMEEPLSGIAQIIFFLLAVMAIVELIDTHGGFKVITDKIYTTSKQKMLWSLVLVSFFMSAILDNLTSMIVMISLLRKLVPQREERWIYGSVIVIAVNAGGAWTTIGDVTTTLLWIHEKITTWNTIKTLFLPSFTNIVVATFFASFLVKGKWREISHRKEEKEPGANWVLLTGVLALIMIPVWKGAFGLPPFMGALFGLGILWVMTDIFHFAHGEKRRHLRLPYVLSRIDVSGVLFFLGILLAIEALGRSGLLQDIAIYFEKHIPNQNYVAVLIGLISSVVDNIPLVAATIGMYDPVIFPKDDSLWQLIAYAAGTGGSILIIGSAAGVAFMGLEKVDFLWYCKKVSWIALIGYFVGIFTYFLQQMLL